MQQLILYVSVDVLVYFNILIIT